jgi:hypothetical protein
LSTSSHRIEHVSASGIGGRHSDRDGASVARVRREQADENCLPLLDIRLFDQ